MHQAWCKCWAAARPPVVPGGFCFTMSQLVEDSSADLEDSLNSGSCILSEGLLVDSAGWAPGYGKKRFESYVIKTENPSENPEGSALIWARKVIMAMVHSYIFHGGFSFVHEWASAHTLRYIPYMKRTGSCMQTCRICSTCQVFFFFHLWATSSEHMHSCIGDPRTYIQAPPVKLYHMSCKETTALSSPSSMSSGLCGRGRFQSQPFNYRAGLTGESYRDSAVILLCWVDVAEQVPEMINPKGRAALLSAHVLPTGGKTKPAIP